MTSGLYRITLVARRLTETRVEQASQRLQSWGVDLHESRWLGQNEAWCTEATLGNISALSLANSLREALVFGITIGDAISMKLVTPTPGRSDRDLP